MGSIRSKFRKLLLGTSFSQEYLCFSSGELKKPLRLFLSAKDTEGAIEVTGQHVFLGYKPLIIGVILDKQDPFHSVVSNSQEVCLALLPEDCNLTGSWRQFPVDPKSVGLLHLEYLYSKDLDNLTLFIFRGVRGQHSLLPMFFRTTNYLLEKFKPKKAANINLPGNLYDQVRIAYSMPRNISLITVGSQDAMNMFPTDLHGPIGERYYVSSLRSSGRACQQVEAAQKLVLSNMPSNKYRKIYKMGGNHMQHLSPADQFEIAESDSEHLGIPLPQDWLRYRELEVVGTFDVEIHRLFFYRQVNSEGLNNPATLAHVHRYYGDWRNRQNLNTPFLIR